MQTQSLLNRLTALVMFSSILFSCSDSKESLNNHKKIVTNKISLNVYKSASCGCCGKWVEHAESSGLIIDVHNKKNMLAIKKKYGIQSKFQSCHTAISKGGYIFEGHIPAKFITAFLEEEPENASGLAVPAMPIGSPGMEVDEHFTPYEIFILYKDGSSKVYASVAGKKEQF